MNYLKIIGFIVLAVVLLWGGVAYNRKLEQQAVQETATKEAQLKEEQERIMASLKIEDVVVGQGEEAGKDDTVTVNYVGSFEDGKEFDNSYTRGQPLVFTLGAGDVIVGWDIGLLGMKVGGKRKLTVPPELAYGSQGAGPILPNTTLYFEVELLGVQSGNLGS